MSLLATQVIETLSKYERMRQSQRRLKLSKRLDDEMAAKRAEKECDDAIVFLRSLVTETPTFADPPGGEGGAS